jgi:Photosynthetic reaction centre cytochrome C subunit
MKSNKKLLIICGIIAFAAMGMVLPHQTNTKRNLKILPADISDKKLDSIMDDYTIALGVKCNFCHAADKSKPDNIDFASDAEPMKENARNMMRMVIDVNQKYFYFDKTTLPVYLNVVNCKTCHRGEPIPKEE